MIRYFLNDLDWNNYQGWNEGISAFTVYWGVDSVFEDAPIAYLSGQSASNYQHLVPDGIQSYGKYCYYIEAIEYGNNELGVVGVSRSNVACAFQQPLLFLPNAFNITSKIEVNRTFGPIASNISNDDYLFYIFNRWGELIFESTDPYEKWKGDYNGNMVATGVYVYVINYKSAEGVGFLQKGTVTMFYIE